MVGFVCLFKLRIIICCSLLGGFVRLFKLRIIICCSLLGVQIRSESQSAPPGAHSLGPNLVQIVLRPNP